MAESHDAGTPEERPARDLVPADDELTPASAFEPLPSLEVDANLSIAVDLPPAQPHEVPEDEAAVAIDDVAVDPGGPGDVPGVDRQLAPDRDADLRPGRDPANHARPARPVDAVGRPEGDRGVGGVCTGCWETVDAVEGATDGGLYGCDGRMVAVGATATADVSHGRGCIWR